MDKIVVWYLRMSVIYFVFGAFIGVAMLMWPEDSGAYSQIHAHFNLLGFMSMMIYGVGYHILPKFSGTYIYSTKIMVTQFWVANAGLIGMSIFWPMHILGSSPAVAGPALMASATLSFAAALLFAFNILKTIKAVEM